MIPPKEQRILVAMSGGVDSAVAALLLVEAGYSCLGVTMRLVPDHPGQSVFEPCCGIEATHDARAVCDTLGIEHVVLHAVERFDEEIIAPFVEEYARGCTPNPCMQCNRLIKFGFLYEQADELDAAYVAMGHFVRLEERAGRFALRRAVHREKDQSYVLAALTQEQLGRALFPLGEFTKDEVRERASAAGLAPARKAESQEICFVHDRDYAGFIEQRTGPAAPGPILSDSGEVLGEHHGLTHYTVGQRRGLGIAAPRPLYVVRLDVARNALIVAYEEGTYCRDFTTGPISWGASPPCSDAFGCRIQIRSQHTAAPGTVRPHDGGATVSFEEPQRSVAPGQWAVFYDGEYVAGAAVITDFTPFSAR